MTKKELIESLEPYDDDTPVMIENTENLQDVLLEEINIGSIGHIGYDKRLRILLTPDD